MKILDNFTQALKSPKLTIVEFWSYQCEWCDETTKKLLELEKQYDIEIFKIDVESKIDLCSSMEIVKLPTLLFLKDGKIIYRIEGHKEDFSFEKKIRELI